MMRCFHLILNWKSRYRTNGFCIPAAHNAWQSMPGLLLDLILLYLGLAWHSLLLCRPGERLFCFFFFVKVIFKSAQCCTV